MHSSVEPIVLVSTRTLDRLPRQDGSVEEIPGGPATYMGRAFDLLGVPYRLLTGHQALVQVVPLPNGEQEYIIPALPPIPLPQRLSGPATVLSPIMREIDPGAIPVVDGLLVVDLQGFVRDPNTVTDHVDRQVDLQGLLSRASVVKASAPEMERLTPKSLSALADTMLVITEGASGAWVVLGGQRHHIPAHPIHVRHTIGAGDTFLASLTAHLVAGLDVLSAAHKASAFTAEVLRAREGVHCSTD